MGLETTSNAIINQVGRNALAIVLKLPNNIVSLLRVRRRWCQDGVLLAARNKPSRTRLCGYGECNHREYFLSIRD